MSAWVSRGGDKLDAALVAWESLLPDLHGAVAADFGSNVGGFTECLLSHGVGKVYAIDTGYGVLAWKLRNDRRVVVMERTNALHAELPEPADLVTIDVAWTRQVHILPAARRLLKPSGWVVSLVKPQYEADRSERRGGLLDRTTLHTVLGRVRNAVDSMGGEVAAALESPLRGAKGSVEFIWLIRFAE